MPPLVRVLALLSGDDLRALADTFDVPVADPSSEASLRQALFADELLLEDVLPELSLPVLRHMCLSLGVPPARSRADNSVRIREALSKTIEVQPPRAPSTPRASARHATARSTFLALDFETADHGRDSACQVAVVRVEDGRIVARAAHYVRPPRPSFLFSDIHGITWNRVRREPTFAELWPRVATLFDGATFIAAHNAPFDRSVLNACCAAAGIPAPAAPFLCTVKLARSSWSLKSARLPDVCRHLGIALRHHDAASDAEACAHIVLAAGADRAQQ